MIYRQAGIDEPDYDTALVLVIDEDGQPEAAYIRDVARALAGGFDPDERWFVIDPCRIPGDDDVYDPVTWKSLTRGDDRTVVELRRWPTL